MFGKEKEWQRFWLKRTRALPGTDPVSLKAVQGHLWEELWVNGTHMGDGTQLSWHKWSLTPGCPSDPHCPQSRSQTKRNCGKASDSPALPCLASTLWPSPHLAMGKARPGTGPMSKSYRVSRTVLPRNLPLPLSTDWSAENWTVEYYNMVSLEIRFRPFPANPWLQVLLFYWLLMTVVAHPFSEFSKIFCKDGVPSYVLSLNLRISWRPGTEQNREKNKRSIHVPGGWYTPNSRGWNLLCSGPFWTFLSSSHWEVCRWRLPGAFAADRHPFLCSWDGHLPQEGASCGSVPWIYANSWQTEAAGIQLKVGLLVPHAHCNSVVLDQQLDFQSLLSCL